MKFDELSNIYTERKLGNKVFQFDSKKLMPFQNHEDKINHVVSVFCSAADKKTSSQHR